MYDAARFAGAALIVAVLWWIRRFRDRAAYAMVTQRILTDHLHLGRRRLERSLRALGCAPFEGVERPPYRPFLRVVRGGVARPGGKGAAMGGGRPPQP